MLSAYKYSSTISLRIRSYLYLQYLKEYQSLLAWVFNNLGLLNNFVGMSCQSIAQVKGAKIKLMIIGIRVKFHQYRA